MRVEMMFELELAGGARISPVCCMRHPAIPVSMDWCVALFTCTVVLTSNAFYWH